MEDNKETIEPKKSVIRTIFFIIYHLGLIGSIIGLYNHYSYSWEDGTDRFDEYVDFRFHIGCMIVCAIGIHLFASLLYKEYTRKDK